MTVQSGPQIRLGADIGGTFTDIALEAKGAMFSTKVLTNYTAPEQAILDGMDVVLAEAGLGYSDLDIVIHGTTLATNALVEGQGARVALVFIGGVGQGMMLPFLAGAALYFRYKRTDARLAPGLAWTVALWIASVALVAAGGYQLWDVAAKLLK